MPWCIYPGVNCIHDFDSKSSYIAFFKYLVGKLLFTLFIGFELYYLHSKIFKYGYLRLMNIIVPMNDLHVLFS